MSKLCSFLLISSLLFSLTGCKKQVVVEQKQAITLNYYRLYDSKDLFNEALNDFRQKYPYVSVNITSFQDPKAYFETIVREIAEGRGPDLFSVPNSWVKSNYKLLSEAPSSLTPEVYQDTFVNVAFQDNAILQSDQGHKIFGIPYSVDTLGLYYNSTHYENSIPERGKPQNTWNTVQLDTQILTSKNSQGIKKSAIAMGDSLSSSRNADIFLLRLLQNKISFYDSSFIQAQFLKNNKSLDIYNQILSYSLADSPNYSWDAKLNQPKPSDKEISAFVQGKTSMIFGYSHLYKDILNKIDLYKSQGLETINKSSVRITESPQEVNANQKVAYAKYMTEVVSRNSKHNFESWALISELASKTNLSKIFKRNFKPSSRRDMIPNQRQNRIYKSFINQLGYAQSLSFPSREVENILNSMFDPKQYEAVEAVQRRKILDHASKLINQQISRNNSVNPIIQVEAP